MKKLTIILLVLILALPVVLLSRKVVFEKDPKNIDNPIIIIKTSLGTIYCELFKDSAPETVEDFLGLSLGNKEFTDLKSNKKIKRKFYNGLIFHRIMPNFMIQVGCPFGTGRGGPGYRFKDEINADSLGLNKIKVKNAVFLKNFMYRYPDLYNRFKDKPVKELYEYQGYNYITNITSHKAVRGSLAMANSGPDSNGSQFFINIIDTPWLYGKHTVFGQVIRGMSIVDKISKAKRDRFDKPVQDIYIEEIKLYK